MDATDQDLQEVESKLQQVQENDAKLSKRQYIFIIILIVAVIVLVFAAVYVNVPYRKLDQFKEWNRI